MTSKPKVLFVDDEEAILSAARRLLRGKNIDVITTASPREALSLLQKEDVWVIVSDFRMPQMTGTELLEEVKKSSPLVTRLMLTGFLEMPIVQEAINRASVFRFVTKPWDESELLLGIETAIQHSGRRRTNADLAHEIGAQNLRLETLSRNLEEIVLERTQGIEESKRMAEGKQRTVRELTGFVKDLSKVKDVPELYETLYYEMKRFAGVGTPYLLILEGRERGKIFWIQSRTIHEKSFSQIPKSLLSLSVRGATRDDKIWWLQNMRKDARELVVIPVRARETPSSQPVAILFVEHDLDKTRTMEFLDRVTERLQPVSVVLDKILLKEQLVAASQEWEATFNGFQDPIAVVDNQERVIRANKSFFKAGVSRCYEMFDGRSSLCVDCPMPKAVLTVEPSSNIVRTSQNRSFRVHCYPVLDERVVRVVNHYTDISRERELYMRLVQSEKLAAVGLLAGNIAHELNNPLSGIRSLAQILERELPVTDPHLQDIVEVEKAVVRCQQIIENLLHFSESPSEQQDSVNLNELVESTIPLLKTVLRNHNLQTYFQESLPDANVQASQMQQVIFNLINNACQAMEAGGTVTVKSWSEGAFVHLSISDTGPGIPSDIQQKIFEPFFTTKGAGVGTGLGLSVSKGIVERAGGELKLVSRMGEGTTFTVVLPSGKIRQ